MGQGFLISYSSFILECVTFSIWALITMWETERPSIQAVARWLIIATTVLAPVALLFPADFTLRHPETFKDAHPFVIALLVVGPVLPLIQWIRWLKRHRESG